jgi:hypothetical protein
MTTTILRQQALTAAIKDCGFLANWMKKPDLATVEQVEPTFDTLAEAIEALPPTMADSAMMCYLRNYIASSRELFNAGDWSTAGYQLRQIRLKFARILADE